MPENEGLKREIGLWGLVANAVNIMVGAGIFILPVVVAMQLGAASISAYAICGGLMILIMLCFSEIGSKITITGGAYTYIEKAFGNYAGFLTTNVFIFGASVTANAAVANGLVDTLSYFLPVFGNRLMKIIFFAVIFGGLTYFNIIGVRNAVGIVTFNTIAKLLPLAMIIIAGCFFIDVSKVNIIAPDSLDDVGKVAVILLFAFAGAETQHLMWEVRLRSLKKQFLQEFL
ncbi:MAG TPA: APC family permease [Bacteroidales bacterium]|nr:APC family permease [Bacteroidales bacterium]